MGHFSEQNFYEILEISPDATAEEIQKAFFKAKSTYSPNSPALYSVFSEDEAKALLRLIDEAYAILSNQAKRRDYDKGLFGKSSTGEGTVTPIQGAVADQTASDLPDFMLPGPESVSTPSPVIATKSNTGAAAIATTPTAGRPVAVGEKKGYGKTIISHYNVDEALEKEIQAQEVFDGTFLQKVRLYKNISLDQLAETSRINKPYILALETNDFHALPAAVYVRGFVATIARLLSLSDKKVADSYMKLFKESRGN